MINWEWTFADDFENNKDWDNARIYMYKQWSTDKYNIKKLLRTSFLCWTICIDNGNLIDSKMIKKEEFKKILDELFNFGLKFFRNEPDFLWMYGYMMTLTPMLFGDKNLFEQVGKQWKYEAYIKSNNNDIIKCIFLEGLDDESRNKLGYKQLCREIIPIIENTFKGNGYMQKYFKSLFLIDILAKS
ncbi:hypothetical protein SDC9_82694 [bioreactor metagenome]|uniref:Uncharacterized protein n=1 Tax=bioreactor metagenome TaxID=1076179 RepID=A0A644Z667_9ZZZZ|nr:hypothetical protein [Romboutsia lituseburensis]